MSRFDMRRLYALHAKRVAGPAKTGFRGDRSQVVRRWSVEPEIVGSIPIGHTVFSSMFDKQDPQFVYRKAARNAEGGQFAPQVTF